MSIVHLTIPAQFRLSPALARAMHTEVWGPPRRMCWFIKPTSRTLRRKRPTFNVTFGVGRSIRAPARENGSSRKARWSARKNPARFESALVAWPRRSAPAGRRRPGRRSWIGHARTAFQVPLLWREVDEIHSGERQAACRGFRDGYSDSLRLGRRRRFRTSEVDL